MPDVPVMNMAELREVVLFVAVLALVLLLVIRRNQVPAGPPAVSPQAMPIEEQMRDVRHRVANFEQHVPVLQDHALRLRGVEQEIAAVRSTLSGLQQGQVVLTQGQARIERQLDMLVQHHVEREKQG